MKKFLSHALATVVIAGSAVIASAPAASAAEWVPCNGSSTQVCYTETGNTGVSYSVPNLAPGEVVHVADVAAYLDIYRIPMGTGGVQIPCITTVVNGQAQDNCARLGFAFVSRTPLVARSVDAQLVKVSGVLATVYVCTARLTATVNHIGVTDIPTLSLCSETAPTTWLDMAALDELEFAIDGPWLGTWEL